MRVVFAGTPEFAVPALEHLIASELDIVGVYTQPDRPAGRGRKLTPSPVKVLALEHNLPLLQPARLDPAAAKEFATVDADVMVVVAYGLILPGSILALPSIGCINVHASLLPRWRGAAPIARAIAAGDRVSGVSIMLMDTGLDTGPVFATRRVDIGPDDTAAVLHRRLALIGAELLVATLPAIAAGRIRSSAQSRRGVTYAHKIKKQEGAISWPQSAHIIADQIRAFNPWPVAYAQLKGERIRLWAAVAAENDVHAPPGMVVAADAAGIVVAAVDGAVRLMCLQRKNGRPLPVREFLNGCRVGVGDRFENG